MSLLQPEKKMSKSAPNLKSRILITDSSDTIKKKVNAALTDSIDSITYDPAARPGLANLLQILYHLETQHGSTTIADFTSEMGDISKKALKERVAGAIDEHLAPVRERYEEVLNADGGRLLDDVARKGAAKASKSAEATMLLVREAIGL
jgi:tryptophanyl-tRNA synthetase